MFLPNSEAFEFWSGNDNEWVASLFLQLGFHIAKGPGNGESAWKDPDWSQNNRLIVVFGHRRPLVNLSARLLDPRPLALIRGFVVPRQRKAAFAALPTHNRPGIAHIGDVAHVLDDQHDDRATARFVLDFACFLVDGQLQEFLFGLKETLN